MTAAWWTDRALSFDTETTGIDTDVDRIVSASCVEISEAGVVRREMWLVNPGVPIPPAASAIHGITDAMAKLGFQPSVAVPQIVARLVEAWGRGLPVVAMNAAFDLTLITREAARLGLPNFEIGPVLDPLIIDRAMDPYRSGKRTLSALAAHHNVKQEGAHSSEGDALSAARVMWRLARQPWPMGSYSLAAMQEWQTRAHAAWAKNFEEHLAAKGTPKSIDGQWPVRMVVNADS